jgi:hypothetical protein
MRISEALGSLPAIVGILAISLAWYAVDAELELFIFLISVLALTFSQLILREGDRDTKRIIAMLEAQIKVDERIPDEVAN